MRLWADDFSGGLSTSRAFHKSCVHNIKNLRLATGWEFAVLLIKKKSVFFFIILALVQIFGFVTDQIFIHCFDDALVAIQ